MIDMDQAVQAMEEEYEFFLTLSGFKRENAGNLIHLKDRPFDLTPEMEEALQQGALGYFLLLGSKSEVYRRAFFNWSEAHPAKYAIATGGQGTLGHFWMREDAHRSSNSLFLALRESCWADVWADVQKPGQDLSSIQKICDKYDIRMFRPLRLQERGDASNRQKTIFTYYYVLLVQAGQEIPFSPHHQKQVLFDLSKDFYRRVAQSEPVANIAAAMACDPSGLLSDAGCCADYAYTVYEHQVLFAKDNGCEGTVTFYKMGLKNLPSLEQRTGLGFAIADALFTQAGSHVDVRESPAIEAQIKSFNPPVIQFQARCSTPPDQNSSALRDW